MIEAWGFLPLGEEGSPRVKSLEDMNRAVEVVTKGHQLAITDACRPARPEWCPPFAATSFPPEDHMIMSTQYADLLMPCVA